MINKIIFFIIYLSFSLAQAMDIKEFNTNLLLSIKEFSDIQKKQNLIRIRSFAEVKAFESKKNQNDSAFVQNLILLLSIDSIRVALNSRQKNENSNWDSFFKIYLSNKISVPLENKDLFLLFEKLKQTSSKKEWSLFLLNYFNILPEKAINSSYFSMYMERCRMHFYIGQFEVASRCFKKMLALDFNKVDESSLNSAKLLQLASYIESENIEDALKYQKINQSPNVLILAKNVDFISALILQTSKKYDLALSSINSLLFRLEKDNSSIGENLKITAFTKKVYLLLILKKYSEALVVINSMANLKQIKSKSYNYFRILYFKSLALTLQKKYSEALTVLSESPSKTLFFNTYYQYLEYIAQRCALRYTLKLNLNECHENYKKINLELFGVTDLSWRSQFLFDLIRTVSIPENKNILQKKLADLQKKYINHSGFELYEPLIEM